MITHRRVQVGTAEKRIWRVDPISVDWTCPLLTRSTTLDAAKIRRKKCNKLIYDCILDDEEFFKESTRTHKLIMVHENTIPWEIHHGGKLPRMDLASSHEEAGVILTKHAIRFGAKPCSKTKALTDDTENFALISYFYQSRSLMNPMIMESLVIN